MAVDTNILINTLPSFRAQIEPNEVDDGIPERTLKPVRVNVFVDKFEPPASTSHTTKALCQLGLLRRGDKKQVETLARLDEVSVEARSAEGKDDEG